MGFLIIEKTYENPCETPKPIEFYYDNYFNNGGHRPIIDYITIPLGNIVAYKDEKAHGYTHIEYWSQTTGDSQRRHCILNRIKSLRSLEETEDMRERFLNKNNPEFFISEMNNIRTLFFKNERQDIYNFILDNAFNMIKELQNTYENEHRDIS